MDFYRQFSRFFRLPKHRKIPGRGVSWPVEAHHSWDEALDYIGNGYNVGFALPENLIVLDIDSRNGGLESYARLLADTGLPELNRIYTTVSTGGGGFHFYMFLPKSVAPQQIHTKIDGYPGIDIKKHGGYVLTAGSRTTDFYCVVHQQPKKLLVYKKLLSLIVKKQKPKQKSTETLPVDVLADLLGALNVENYRDNDSWFPLLCAAHNATRGNPVARDLFCAWSTADPQYANDGDTIAMRWDSLDKGVENPITIGTILAEIPPESRPASLLAYEFDASTEASPIIKKVAETYSNLDDLPFLIAQRIVENNRIIHAADQEFWRYNGTHWERFPSNLLAKLIYDTYAEFNEDVKMNAVLDPVEKILRPMCAVSYTPGTTESEDYSVVNCRNGELWIENKTGNEIFCPHDPESRLSMALNIEYDPHARCPIFSRTLNEIFARYSDTDRKELIRHFWELLGYTLQSNKNLDAMVLFYGRGSNGKSLILKIIQRLLGDAAFPIDLNTLNKDVHATAALVNKLALIDDDMVEHMVLPSNLIKKFAGNSMISVNPKYEKPYSFRQTAMIWGACNTTPTTRDMSDGTKRRMNIFTFTRKFEESEVDIDLAQRIYTTELPGILNAAISALKRLRNRKILQKPRIMQSHIEIWYGQSDATLNFYREELQPAPGRSVPLNTIWERYESWSYESGLRREKLSKHRFVDALRGLGVDVLRGIGGSYIVYGYLPRPLCKNVKAMQNVVPIVKYSKSKEKIQEKEN